MNRPCDWLPLAEADPLPGDPDAITVEATRLSRLGEEMRAQVARLRQIGADTTLIGAYAEELRSASTDLAKDLDQVAGRYERVGSALRGWAPELAEAQARTLPLRTKAMAAEVLRQQSLPVIVDPGWGQTVSSTLMDPEAARRLAGQNEAEAMLAEARRALVDIVEHAGDRGRHYADLIDEATDILKDSRWDNVKDWADRNADWIDARLDDLGWVATAAAIGAIFLPGANVLVFTALGLTALSAVAHGTLLATGNGSWADFGLDILALATFGAGAAAARGLKSAQLAARAAAAGEAREAAVQSVLRATDNEARTALRILSRASSSSAERLTAEHTLRAIDDRALREGLRAAENVARQPLAAASRWEAFVVGEPGSARSMNDLIRTATQYPGATGVDEALTAGARYYGAAQGSFVAGTGADLFSKGDDIAAVSKHLFTMAQGSSWFIQPQPGEFV